MIFYQITYINRRGAHVAARFTDYDRAVAKLATIKCPAKLTDASGAVLGVVEESDGRCDDRRIKWIWFAEARP